MRNLKRDIGFIAIVLIVNNLLQVSKLDNSVMLTFKVMYTILVDILVAMIALTIYNCKKNNYSDKDMYTWIVMYLTGYEVVHIVLSICGIINIYDTIYGIIWVITTLAYTISFSHSILSLGLMLVAQGCNLIVQLFNYAMGNESISLTSLITTYVVISILILANIVRCKKQIDKEDKIQSKRNIEYYLTKETKPFKFGRLMHMAIWLVIISTVVTIARYQFYDIMSYKYVYALIAALSITLPTFIMLSAMTNSVLVIEVFALYVASEIYTLSYLVFIQEDSWNEITTAVVDCMILGYMITKYRMIKKEQTDTASKA